MTSIRSLELLAPAKNLECGIAAVDHGADAVYIGASRFGARAAAGNSVDDIRQLCQYAHPFGVKVYVTVNTLILDHELEATRQLLSDLADAGIDAILVQDMAVLHLLPPKLTLHASTQTDNRTPEKVRWLRDLGFSRVVLARELSVDEIAAIHEAVPDVELEVFVHGALCVSYSGRCYASQHCFSRSANRGECAQVCRMKFDLIDGEGNELIHQRHLLSLKDLCQMDYLEELAAAGATSFKIEGRLKDVCYVKNVVAAYSQRLDDLVRRHPNVYQRAARGHCRYSFVPQLDKTFNRGFTNYFLHGRHQGISSPDTPKAIGEFVGTVKELRRDSFTVAGTASFANGDGLCFINRDRELEGFRVNRAQGNRLFPQQMPQNLRPGLALYRNHDMQFERVLSGKTSERKIPLLLHLSATSDGFALSASGVTASVRCSHQQAEKPQRENIIRQLSKLGGTPYECSGVELSPAEFPYFIPASLLSDLRQQLVAALMKRDHRDGFHDHSRLATTDQKNRPHDPDTNISNRMSQEFYGAEQLTAYELHPDLRPLMQCRYCLRYELGSGDCPRLRPQKVKGAVPPKDNPPKLKYPLFLRLADGRRFRLEFDCKHCQMNIYAS